MGQRDHGREREYDGNVGKMQGNVWEWVEDCWSDRYDGALDDGSAWTSGDCRQRVLRGGTWRNVNWDFRSANRFARPAHEWVDDYGFRVARMLDS
jgi:formylglycine-generating enzyme required for sulfatase activity